MPPNRYRRGSSFHDRKRKFDRRDAQNQPKPKKGKFDFKKASYVKERDAKKEDIEARKKMLREKEEEFIRRYEGSDPKELTPYEILYANLRKSEIAEKKKEMEAKASEMNNELFFNQGREEEITTNPENDRDDLEDTETAQEDPGQDPFFLHLRHDMDDQLYKAVSATPQMFTSGELGERVSWPMFKEELRCYIPKPIEEKDKPIKIRKLLDSDEEKEYTKCGKIPTLIENMDLNKLHIVPEIRKNLKANYNDKRGNTKKNPKELFTPLQRGLFSVINNYQDLYFCSRTFSNADQIRFVYCLHVINHLLKTKKEIAYHDSKLAESDPTGMEDVPDEYRDQGWVRPKVLFIVPHKHSCLKIVETLISIFIGEGKGKVINKQRFMENFTGNELAIAESKPEDYKSTFQGNINEKFRIGIGLQEKTMKLYTKLYNSDIIIASTLGLKITINGEDKQDYDFLSSIELLIMDQIDTLFMQNVEHLINVLSYLHLSPKASHKNINYPRVRSWCMNDRSKYYRQTLIFSSIPHQWHMGLMDKVCFNYAGKVDILPVFDKGSVFNVVLRVPQVFYKYHSTDYIKDTDDRMEFFMNEILPRYKDPSMNHTLIYVPSHFDFLALRYRFIKEKLNFQEICENTEDGKVAKARDMFFHGKVHFLLYTERWHFYRRTKIKGIRHIIFYQPPTYPHFYSEMCNLLQRMYQDRRAGIESNISVKVVYNHFDTWQMPQIAGISRYVRMCRSEKKVHTITRR